VAVSTRQFRIDLYREHLEDASFLYDQHRAYQRDPEVNWIDLRAWEERIEAHLDALVVGGRLALQVCEERALEGDAGEKHAALRVFCRADRKDETFAVLRQLDPGNAEALRASAEALCRDVPSAWGADLAGLLQGEPHELAAVAARVIGFRRFPFEALLRHSISTNTYGRAALAWALGRIGSDASIPVLRPLLDERDAAVCKAAATALLRLGDQTALARAMAAAPRHAWAQRLVAIAARSSPLRVLLDALQARPRAGTVLALGLAGDLGAVQPLLALLENEQLAEAAAVALNTITGAELYAPVFIPDTFDPDELLPEEREAYDTEGKLPSRNGEPFGNWERRPLRSKDVWSSWLDEHQHRFSREHLWRMGRPRSPLALYECLAAETTPYDIRSATYEELVVRFGLEVPFEVDLLVTQQLRYLANIRQWVSRDSRQFER
jgi:hypothetical protein